MLIAQYFVEFIFYSFLGWVWESIYCSAKEKKWADRGFLFGPICPIYGSCVVVTSIVFSSIDFLNSPDFPAWGIFIISCLGSAVAEYATSWGLEKRFHARWWDYSDVPLNLNGRICLPASIGFGLAGVAVVKFLMPAIEGMHAVVNPLVYEIFALLFAALFGADYALTEASLSALLKEVEKMHEDFNVRAQENYEKLTAAPKRLEQKIIEEKELAEMKRNQLAKAYAARLSLNQKRVLLGIKKFMPRTGFTQDAAVAARAKLVETLSDRVRELRKKNQEG